MCDTCREEYADVNDRRFHAQPIACNECGPHYTLRDSEGNEDTVYIRIVSRISDVLSNGGVVALKSLGGYNLICDADNEQAVAPNTGVERSLCQAFGCHVSGRTGGNGRFESFR